MISNPIYTVFDKMLRREDKEELLKQHGLVIWMTGLSGSGKSTLAIALEKELHKNGRLTCVLDGDNIRSGLNSDLGFSSEDRIENIRRIAEVCKLFVDNGVIVISAFICPTNNLREMASQIIGSSHYFEIYVSTPLAICEARDHKGLYAKARSGEIKDFTGLTAPFDIPLQSSLIIDTSAISISDAVKRIMEKIIGRIK